MWSEGIAGRSSSDVVVSDTVDRISGVATEPSEIIEAAVREDCRAGVAHQSQRRENGQEH
jgi:hypothetical protein